MVVSNPNARRRTARHPTDRRPLALLLVGVALAGCGVPAAGRAAAHRRRAPATTTTAPTTTTPVPAPTTTAPTTTSPPPTTSPPTTAPPPTTSPPTTAAGPAEEVVVDAPAFGSQTATLTAWSRGATGWQQVFGPWTADVGYNGVAPPGQKTEGDGRTPSGTYGFDFFFGVEPDPGVAFPYRPVTGPNIVWDDDPSSPLYNQWVDDSTADPGADPEPMDNPPAYDYGAVIAYNTDPVVPGKGSAIFLHESTGGATAGCVSLPPSELLAVLRWLEPADDPVIEIGVGAPAP